VNYNLTVYSQDATDVLDDTGDQVGLHNSPAQAPWTLVDFVAWDSDGSLIADQQSDDDQAAASRQWTDGDYVDTSQLASGETLGRDKDSTDTNEPADWQNASTNKADAYGINSDKETPGAQNVPEFGTVMVPMMAIIVIYALLRRTSDKGNKKRKRTR